MRSVARRFGRALRWKDRFLERLEREQILHPSCRSVVVLSEIGRRQFLGVYPEVEDKIRVLPIGIDLDRFERGHRARSRTQIRRRWGIPDDRSIALFVGHHFRLKGLWPALEAIARIREDRRPHLLVCGRSAPPLSTVERLGLREFVTFAGAVAGIEPVLLGADLLLQPTFYDPCSHVTLEAWAAGLPVVTTPWNGASELARGSPAVSIVDDPWDLDGLGRGIMEALDDETWKERSAAAREIAEGHSLERHMGELEDLLSEASSKVAKEGARAS
ncbi:MAG: glycosyltransferase family 4 protein [Planctomycetota bacterium]|nr:glycosyltransferase family 4 protein [Planctomycetota bacterium]